MRARLRTISRLYRRSILIGGAIIILAVLLVGYLGFYPIAVVNGDWITARRFRLHLAAAEHYEVDQVATSTTTSILKDSNLIVSVLDGLIEEVLIEKEARKEFASRLDSLRSDRIRSFLDQTTVIKAESERYGLSVKKFQSEILEPQVTRDLLSGRLFLKSTRLEDWLAVRKVVASVTIFSDLFYWDGRAVKIRK